MDPNPDDPSSSVPYSPFTSFGAPVTKTRGSLLSPANAEQQGGSNRRANVSSSATSGRSARLRARDLYGGPLMFGGSSAAAPSTAASLRRSNRLLVTTPYHRPNNTVTKATNSTTLNNTAPSLRTHNATAPPATGNFSFGAPSASMLNSSNSGVSPSSASPMSSTAQVILDTLEKVSTPLKDAQKIPVPRAERRRAIAQELLKGGPSAASSRRRPRLGNMTFAEGSAALSGPPLRTVFSPVSAKGKTRTSPPTATSRSGQPKPVIVERRKTPRETMEEAAAEASLSSTSGGGKLRAKVCDKSKGREMSKLDDEVEETPEYLTKSSDNPFLNMKAMPSLAFSTPAPGKTPEVMKKANPAPTAASLMPETPKSSKSAAANAAATSPSAMFKAPAKAATNSFTGAFVNPLSKQSPAAPAKAPSSTSTSAAFLTSSSSSTTTSSQIPPAVVQPSSTLATTKSTNKSQQPSYTFRAPAKASGAPTKRPHSSGDHEPKFSFRAPKAVKKSDASPPPSTSSSASSTPPTSGLFGKDVAAPNVAPFSTTTVLRSSPPSSSLMMPDLTKSSGFGAASGGMMMATNKLKTGSVMDVLGGGVSHKLPDVTESTPTSTLKKGSVMDILGKSATAWNGGSASSSTFGTSSSNNSPWN